MGAPDNAGLFEVGDIKRTELVGDDKDAIGVIAQAPERDPDDPIKFKDANDESAPFELWQHYGMASRPPKDGQFFGIRFGSILAAIATRIKATAQIFGQLAAGDVALYSIGKNLIKLGAKGTITAIVTTTSGKQIVMDASAKGNGWVKIAMPNKMVFEMSDKGIVLNAGPERNITLACKQLQFNAQKVINNSPVFQATMQSKAPLAAGLTGIVGAIPPNPGLIL